MQEVSAMRFNTLAVQMTVFEMIVKISWYIAAVPEKKRGTFMNIPGQLEHKGILRNVSMINTFQMDSVIQESFHVLHTTLLLVPFAACTMGWISNEKLTVTHLLFSKKC